MNKIEVQIWGRAFKLDVVFQNYPGEDVTKNQRETLAGVSTVDFTPARAGVEDYILRFFRAELGSDNMSNIFRFVMPKSILISREDVDHVFAVMCNFKLDMEHGIAIVFTNEKYTAAGPKDLIL